MNYEEAVAYIEETPKFTKKNSLEHTKECLRRLGNPQEKFKERMERGIPVRFSHLFSGRQGIPAVCLRLPIW